MFRNAVITGACGGLGQALARQLIKQGAHVALVGMNTDTLQVLADLAPERCRIYTPDVSDAAAMQAVASDWLQVGTPDLVIANAGVILAVALIVLARYVTRPWAIPVGWVLQALVVLTGLLAPPMFIVGGIFALLWGVAIRLGRQVDNAAG